MHVDVCVYYLKIQESNGQNKYIPKCLCVSQLSITVWKYLRCRECGQWQRSKDTLQNHTPEWPTSSKLFPCQNNLLSCEFSLSSLMIQSPLTDLILNTMGLRTKHPKPESLGYIPSPTQNSFWYSNQEKPQKSSNQT
jgi:hypothetical protein